VVERSAVNRLVVGSNPTSRAMELDEFITNTLISINKGVGEANKQADNRYVILPNKQVVNFDVAVEVSTNEGSKKGGGLKIHVVELGANKSVQTSSSNISRINFTVGVQEDIE
jgi:hypothetical protein